MNTLNIITFLATAAVALATDRITSLDQAADLVREGERYSEYIDASLIDGRPYMTHDEHRLAQQMNDRDHNGHSLDKPFEPSPLLRERISQHARLNGLNDPFDDTRERIERRIEQRQHAADADTQMDRLLEAYKQELDQHNQAREQHVDKNMLIDRIKQLEQAAAEANSTSLNSPEPELNMTQAAAIGGVGCVAGMAGLALARRRKPAAEIDLAS
jgi:hypothetical protein